MTIQHALLKPSPERWQPRAIQKKGVRWLLEHHPGAGLLFGLGLGKTTTTLAAIKILKQQGLRPKALVVAPLRVMGSTWPDELARWADFKGLTYTVLHGPKKDLRLREDVDLYLINPEGLTWLLDPVKVRSAKGKKQISVDVRRFKKLGFNLLVVDELTMFKNHASDRFKMMKQVLPTFQRRWGLTASPAARYLEPLFGQIYVLDEGAALGRYVTHYRNAFFDLGRDGFTYTAKPGAEEAIHARLAHAALRADTADYVDLPTLVETQVMVELPTSARRVYDELERELITLVGDRVVTAKNAAVAAGRCRQVASGALYDAPDLGERMPTKSERTFTALHDAKLDALEELLEELQGTPALVVYEFQHDYQRIRERFGQRPRVGHVGKGVGLAEGRRVQDAWNRGELDVLLGHGESVARGLNLQFAGNHILWYTLTWDYELYYQLIGRLRRPGSKHARVFSHALLAKGTVDEHVWAALKAKEDCQNRFFAGLKALQKGMQ